MRETGTGQQVAHLHDRYMMMMIKDITFPFVFKVHENFVSVEVYV
jgi:predicted lipid carrier protein YhbT